MIETANYNFEVVETPGHSEDHISLTEPEQGWCFSGDLFVSKKNKVLRPEENIRHIMFSMQKLLDRNHELTPFTAIGKVEKQSRPSLSSCLNYLCNLEQEANRMHRDEGLTPDQIVEKLPGGESRLAEPTDNQFAAKNLVNSLLNN